MRPRIVAMAVLVVTSVCASGAVYASPATVRVPVQAMFGKSKLVNFTLRNATSAPLKLRAGDAEMTVEAGKTADLHLPVGAKVVTEESSSKLPAGTVLAQVTNELKNTTIVIN